MDATELHELIQRLQFTPSSAEKDIMAIADASPEQFLAFAQVYYRVVSILEHESAAILVPKIALNCGMHTKLAQWIKDQ